MSSTTATSGVSTTDPYAFESGTSRVPQKTLTQNDFLKLLTTKLTSQDPMNPQSDENFIAQMAQFSALEATNAMQKNLANLGTQQQFATATSLLGQTVKLQVDTDKTTQGVVTALTLNNGVPKIMVNGTSYDLSQVLTVSPTPNK